MANWMSISSFEKHVQAKQPQATGTDKMKPLVITHAKRPRAFGKTFKPALYCNYYYDKKAWMTALVFNDWHGP